MATINGYLMGSSQINTQSVLLESHTGFTFFGDGILDDICVRNEDLSDTQILNTSVSTETEWDIDVILLANMNNTADGSDVIGYLGDLQSWDIYRLEVATGEVTPVVMGIDIGNTSWIDWKSEGGGKTYQYQIYVNTETQISSPIVSEDVKMNWSGYYLISSDADSTDWDTNQNVEYYKFDLNLTSDKESVNNSATFTQGFGKFDSVTILDRNMRSGDFTSILIPQYNGDYDFAGQSDWTNYMSQLSDFISSKDYKIYKNKLGQKMKVVTANSSSTSHEKQFDEQNSVGNQSLITMTIYFNEVGICT